MTHNTLTEEIETILETGNLCIRSLLYEVHSFVGFLTEASLERTEVEVLSTSRKGSVATSSPSLEALKGSRNSLFA